MRHFLKMTVVLLWVAASALAAGPDRTPPFEMPEVTPPTFPDRIFDIRDFGAVGDGTTKATESITKAIAACAEAGGGRVVVPAGRWLSGAIHLRSNTALHLEEGAVLTFSTDPEDYLPPVFVRWAGFECYNYSPLIYARECENIAVTGGGRIDGNGRPWWPWVRRQKAVADEIYDMVKRGTPPSERIFGSPEHPMRPQLFQPINCRNVLLEGVTITSGPFWTVQFVYCENVRVRNVTMHTEGPNNDGINADSCRNVIIEDCTLSTGDDGVAIKSGLNEDGRRVNRPCENIIVRRVTCQGGHSGVAIGSEMSSGVRNVFVHDCVFNDVWRGFWIKSTRGRGGFVENIYYTHTTITHATNEALGITTAYTAWFGSDEGESPRIRNIRYDHITIPWTNHPIRFEGLPEAPLENIVIADSDIVCSQPPQFRRLDGLRLENVALAPHAGEHVAEVWDGRNILLKNVHVPPGAEYLLSVHGAGSEAITVSGTRLPEGMRVARMDADVPPHAVTLED